MFLGPLKSKFQEGEYSAPESLVVNFLALYCHFNDLATLYFGALCKSLSPVSYFVSKQSLFQRRIVIIVLLYLFSVLILLKKVTKKR